MNSTWVAQKKRERTKLVPAGCHQTTTTVLITKLYWKKIENVWIDEVMLIWLRLLGYLSMVWLQ